MRLSDISVQRPVLAMVIAALIIAFGLLALNRLPLQENPTIDPPVVTIDTRYPGASANVVETGDVAEFKLRRLSVRLGGN